MRACVLGGAAGASAAVSADSSRAYGRAGEGWVLSPGKVLTHRQESRAGAARTREEQLNIGAALIYLPTVAKRR